MNLFSIAEVIEFQIELNIYSRYDELVFLLIIRNILYEYLNYLSVYRNIIALSP